MAYVKSRGGFSPVPGEQAFTFRLALIGMHADSFMCGLRAIGIVNPIVSHMTKKSKQGKRKASSNNEIMGEYENQFDQECQD